MYNYDSLQQVLLKNLFLLSKAKKITLDMKTRHKIVGSAENRKLNPMRSFLFLEFSFPKKLSIYHSLLFNDNETFICTYTLFAQDCAYLRLYFPQAAQKVNCISEFDFLFPTSSLVPAWAGGGLFHRRNL